MKKLSIFLLCTFLFVVYSAAQNIPHGMKYQAVARDLKGEVLANTKIQLRINLVSKKDGNQYSHYSEVHSIVTNQLGLFTLVVGDGKTESGDFDKVPWSNSDIWMEIQIKKAGDADFISISNSQLLAVPYAYYAATAGELVRSALEENPMSNKDLPEPCACDEGIAQLKVLYTGGPAAVTINVYRNKNLTELLHSFPGTTSGTILTISSSYPDGKLKDFTFFQIVGNPAVAEIPTQCDDPIVGQNFGNFSVLSRTDKKNDVECTVCDVRSDWHVGGNGLMDLCNILGSRSNTDVVFITNNIERARIKKDGDVNITNNLEVGLNLTVGKNVYLNAPFPGLTGQTINNGPFTVANMSPTVLSGILTVNKDATFNEHVLLDNTYQSTSITTGTLVVNGGVGIGKNLNVGGAVNFGGTSAFGGALNITDLTQSTSTTTGAVIVAGGVGIGKNLNVGGALNITDLTQSTSTTTGAVIVGGGVGIGKNLNVGQATHLIGGLTVDGGSKLNDSLSVTKNTTNFVVTINNTNEGNGDGIKIKLGRAKSVYSPPSVSSLLSESQMTNIRNLISCNFTEAQKIALLGTIAADGILDDLKVIGGLAVSAGNYIIDFLNTELSLPITLGPLNIPAIVFPALNTPAIVVDVPVIPTFTLPGIHISDAFELVPAMQLLPEFEAMPELPEIDLSSIGVDPIDIGSVSFWGVPTLCLEDVAGSSPMNNSNEFIRFADKNDAKMGSIRGVSVTNWATNFLNPAFMYKLYGALTSSKADKFHAQYHFKYELSTAIANYASLGVEYSSGNGDYAEWLERKDEKELITPGDIVAVKGGKLTKDLSAAEQVMVVSHNPIVLGNVPKEGRNYAGNNVAFMGQVPVKVMGPVSTGDYIVGQKNTPGYGIAKHPNDMTIEDFKYAVGRSWVNDFSEGPKMVNTVVGVHNGDYLKILKNFEAKFNDSESRLKALESKVDELIKPKKGF